ncbi:MAG: SpoIIE family protein phosphatase [Bryobacteraceae bacterium]
MADARFETGLTERPEAVFVVVSPTGQRTKVDVNAVPFTVGRHSGNSLMLQDNRISREHMRVLWEDGGYVLQDQGSRHGVWVNGERVSRRTLRNSDVIEFGVRDCYQLTFLIAKDDIHRLMDHISHGSGERPLAAGELSKLRSLMEVARALQNSLSTQEILAAVVDAALNVTGCERGFLLMQPEDGEDLTISVARDKDRRALPPGDLRVPTSIIRRALASRKDLLSMTFDPFEERSVRPENTIAALDLRSVVCLPLIRLRGGEDETRAVGAMEDTAGILYMDSRKTAADLSGVNRELLQALAVEASTILENARLLEQERLKVRMESELRVAREIQRSLQPVYMPTTGWFRAAGSSIASTQVGGDYFDIRQMSDESWAAVVADVCGKGVSSALLASLLQGTFLMASGELSHIGLKMERLNEFLLDRTRGEKYATVFYCILHQDGVLTYVNAGHCAPFLMTADGRLKTLHTTAVPVGMIERSTFEVQQVRLNPRDKLVVYSDGLTEAEDTNGVFFDTDRLRDCLRKNAALSAVQLHEAIIRAVDDFSEGGAIRDDVTALVIEYVP